MLRRRHRPRSPLSLETVSPQATDLDTDGIIGSDDELDEATRASQHRRIEQLADSCRQGHPLFILSASLRGPLDKDWANPWKKSRKRKTTSPDQLDGLHAEPEKPKGPVVQETDPRKQGSDESSRSCRHRRPGSVYTSPTYDAEQPAGIYHHPHPTPRRDEQIQSSQSRAKRPRSVPGEEYLTQVSSPVCPPSNDGWLKKDRTFPYLNYIDPPSSPTRALCTHPRANSSKRRLIKEQSIRRIPSSKSQNFPMAVQKERNRLVADKSNSVRRSESVNVDHTPDTAGPPSSGHCTSHPCFSDGAIEGFDPGASLIVSSSSQLPKLEYRRRKRSESSKKRRSKSSPILKERHTDERYSPSDMPAHTRNDDYPRPSDRVTCKEAISRAADDNQIDGDHQPDVDDGTHGFCPAKRITSFSTGEEMIENLPSAQPLPKNLSITDCETSLHSTAVPKRDAEQDGDTNSQALLSTQTAAVLVQKSFQNNIDSPEQVHTTFTRNRRSSQSPYHNRSHPSSITPFYELTASRRSGHSQSNGTGISTQYMTDAMTPSKINTGKKSTDRPGTSTKSKSKSKSGNKKHKNASFAISSRNVSPSPEHRILCQPERGEAGSDIDEMSHRALNHRSSSQLTALPFTLTGSTPPTAQGAQWADSTDSFNLNQAIADAGSWLQQTSFDLNHELKQCSKTAPASSVEAQQSALSLDTVG